MGRALQNFAGFNVNLPYDQTGMELLLPCKESNQLEGHQGAVRAVRFNYDGNYCLTCGSDKLLKLWNPHKGVLLKTYTGHGYEVLDAAGSGDNSRLASCGADKTVVHWDVATGQILRRFRGHTGVSDITVIIIIVSCTKLFYVLKLGSRTMVVRCLFSRNLHHGIDDEPCSILPFIPDHD